MERQCLKLFEILIFNQINLIAKSQDYISNNEEIFFLLNNLIFTEKENKLLSQIDLIVKYNIDKFLLIESKNYQHEWIVSQKEYDYFLNKIANFEERYKNMLLISMDNIRFSKNINVSNEIKTLNLTKWLEENF